MVVIRGILTPTSGSDGRGGGAGAGSLLPGSIRWCARFVHAAPTQFDTVAERAGCADDVLCAVEDVRFSCGWLSLSHPSPIVFVPLTGLAAWAIAHRYDVQNRRDFEISTSRPTWLAGFTYARFQGSREL